MKGKETLWLNVSAAADKLFVNNMPGEFREGRFLAKS